MHSWLPSELGARSWAVIVLDDANLPADAMVSTTAAQIARSVVDHLGAQDLASVTFIDSGRRQNVTADRELLRAAIDSTAPHPQQSGSMNALQDALHRGRVGGSTPQGLTGGGAPGPCAYRGPYHTAYACVVDTLVNAANALLAAPEGRKTLVFISPGVPFDFSMSELRGWQSPGEDVLALQSMLKALQQANVNVYAIDPSGVLAGIMGPRQDSLRVLAEENGGRVTLATITPWVAVPQIFRENSAYYLIGFRSTNPTKDGGFRRVQVKVDRPELEVRARRGYFAPEPERTKPPKTAPPPVAPLDKAIGEVVPGGDLPLALSVAPFAMPGQSKAALAITIALREPPRNGIERVELVTTAVNDDCIDCDSRPTRRDTVEFRRSADSSQGPADEALSRLAVPPGRYNVRIAARTGDRLGNVFTDIDVPKFDRDRLSASGLVLSAAEANTAQKTLLADVVPLVPTAVREFAPTAKVTAFMRVYQGGLKPPGAVRVRATIVDGTDRNWTR